MKAANIWCVGRNYAAHARELGNPTPSQPLIFLKAGSCLTPPGPLVFPPQLETIHYECELAIQLGSNLEPVRAGVALDFTARDVQEKLKKQAHPWTLAKSFRQACGLGEMQIADWQRLQTQGELRFWLNGELRQHGFFKDMIFSISELVDYIKAVFPVEPGDILLTGTPEGVGPLQPGDRLRAEVTGLPQAEWQIAR